jgi:hypothetical protein
MISRAKCLLVIFILVAIPFESLPGAARDNFAKAYALYSSGSLTRPKNLQAALSRISLADYSLTIWR